MSLVKNTLITFMLVFIQTSIVSSQMFTSITAGPHVNDGKGSRSVNFIDLNNDTYPDLFISNGKSGGENNLVYINNQDGTFTELLSGDIVSDNSSSDGASFADFNNDGNIDGFVGNWYSQNNLLYLSNDSGIFSLQPLQIPSIDNGYTESSSFSDIDNDGDLDLYVLNSGGNQRNFLYINNGNGMFSKDSLSVITQDTDVSRCGVWADYDNDGDQDLFIANETLYPNRLYENLGDGTFIKITSGAIVTDMANSWGASWGDYDNDGDLDLFVVNNSNQYNFLYQNNGDKTFTKISTGNPVIDFSYSISSSWIDYDNDGDLDLFVANGWGTTPQTNLLYTNDGFGSFSKAAGESIITDQGWSYGSGWADFDKDGDLDLMVAKWLNETENNAFYKNNTGSFNNWISLKCIGTQSNISAIGTKVFIKATINGLPVWQMQEITSQNGYCSQNSLDVSFGLGDAVIIDSLIIEWTHAVKNIQTSVSINQFLTIYEDGVQIKANKLFGSAPLEVQFDNISGLSVNSYNWNFFDSFSSTDASPLHTFESAGLYNTELEITTNDSTYNKLRNNFIAVYGDTILPLSVNGKADDTVRIPIELHNYLPLSSITVPFQWSGDFNIKYLSISKIGLESEFMNFSVVQFDPSGKRLTFKLESPDDSLLQSGIHIVAEAVFVISETAPFGTVQISLTDYLTYSKESVSPFGSYASTSIDGTITHGCCLGFRGNINGDTGDNIDISDLMFLIAFMFQSGVEPPCPDEADVNGSGGNPAINISDLVTLIAYMFQEGTSPSACI